MTIDAARAAIALRLAEVAPGRVCVGFSGGLDSSVLLHLLARMPQARARSLRAIHVDHALHADAAAWAQQCRDAAAAIDVPFVAVTVTVDRDSGLGTEAAARAARYAAFATQLRHDDILALAHHRDDQIETLLLRLLHAAGNEGLAGMRAWRPLGAAWLWRPLLAVPRADLQAYAEQHRLAWIDDPSNADPQFSRNRLRHAVLPALRTAWPDADRRLAASAMRLRDEADALDALAAEQLHVLQTSTPGALDIAGLRALPAALRRRVLGHWLDAHGLPRPPPGIWQRLAPDLLDARDDATPRLAWRGAELRRYRGSVFALHERDVAPPDWRTPWDGTAPLDLPHGFGRLALQPARTFDTAVTVGPRQGGERLRVRGIQRPLRLLLQELALPPWRRERLPLLFGSDGGDLLAAGDLAFADAFADWLRLNETRLHWTPGD